MNIPNFTENVNIHQSLPDQPTLTPTELKIKWDEGVAKIKNYINNILIPALNNGISDELDSQRASIIAEVTELLNDLEAELNEAMDTLDTDLTQDMTNLNTTLTKKMTDLETTINSKITAINNSLSTVANATTASVTMGSKMTKTYEHTYKQGNVVHSRVEMNTSISGNQTVTLFTLPSGYRPTGTRKSTVIWSNGDFDGRYNATIHTSGAVQISVGQIPPTSIVADVNFVI